MKKREFVRTWIVLAAGLVGGWAAGAVCLGDVPRAPATSVQTTPFGRMPDVSPIELYTLTNASGMRVTVMNYGTTLTSVYVLSRVRLDFQARMHKN